MNIKVLLTVFSLFISLQSMATLRDSRITFFEIGNSPLSSSNKTLSLDYTVSIALAKKDTILEEGQFITFMSLKNLANKESFTYSFGIKSKSLLYKIDNFNSFNYGTNFSIDLIPIYSDNKKFNRINFSNSIYLNYSFKVSKKLILITDFVGLNYNHSNKKLEPMYLATSLKWSLE